MASAKPWLLAGASLAAFLCWFVGETALFSRLFSYFHERTHFRELLPTVATVYFLQMINSLIASGAFALYLRTRKRVPWITAGCTLMFQAYIDTMLLAIISLVVIFLVPGSPMHGGLYYAAAAVGIFVLIAAFWLGGEPRNGLARWLYQWPHMISFRDARPTHYAKLMAIRFAIYVGASIALYAQLRSFHIAVPLVYVFALTPFIMAAGNSLISPAGIGTTQFVFTLGFAQFASREQLLAVSLAATAFNFIFRIPMGLAMGRSLVDEISVVTRRGKRTEAMADSD
jgi:uncharacterized membrane protein YbhN (UPF0104 family)